MSYIIRENSSLKGKVEILTVIDLYADTSYYQFYFMRLLIERSLSSVLNKNVISGSEMLWKYYCFEIL